MANVYSYALRMRRASLGCQNDGETRANHAVSCSECKDVTKHSEVIFKMQ